MKQKLFMAGVSLGLAVLMVVTASLAWYTISTNPEISGLSVTLKTDVALLVSKDNKEYGQLIYLGDEFIDYVGLKPISTVNGLDWFIATYDSEGELNPVEESMLATDANLNVTKPEEGVDDYYLLLQEAVNNGYYISTTFWLMTQEEGGVDVRLSVPGADALQEDWEFDQSTYGTYALSNYSFDSEDGEATLAILDKAAETALRVGFLMEYEKTTITNDVSETGQVVEEIITENYTEFYIYEPNGDQRSQITVKPDGVTSTTETDGTGGYVFNYEFDSSTYITDKYLTTTPLGYLEDGTIGLVDIDPTHLTVQSASAWDDEALETALLAGENPDVGWSNYVDEMGWFALDTAQLMTDGEFTADNSGEATESTVILSLEEDVPVMVTMFIWIEGQDPDCWNDIAASSLVLNLELAATVK